MEDVQLVSMKEMLEKARVGHYAVGQFNINNLEWISAILDECQELKTPVILGVSEGAARYMGGCDTIVGMVLGYMKDNGITVPVALHVDHGSSFEFCKTAIDAGFSSVMIDASHHEINENIAIVKKVTDYAHAHKPAVSVEAEVGHVGGQEDDTVSQGVLYADPNDCVRLVKEAHLDALAPALGSVHGPYHGEPKLGFKEMEEIAKLVNIPLVLHGGSGIPAEQIRHAIQCGTCKINVNTECQMAFNRVLRKVVVEKPTEYDPRKLLGPAKQGIRDTVKMECEWFGCIGKAA
jgi:fructose-bisphosphate aldolase class II